MSSTIRTTVTEAVRSHTGSVPAGYDYIVNAVIEAVTEAVADLAEQAADSLRDSGRALGATETQIEDALVTAGLVEKVEVEDVDSSDADDRLTKVEAAVASLTEGLSRLTSLAERHFGSRF